MQAMINIAAICCGNTAAAMVYDALPPVIPQVAAHFGGGQRGEAVAQVAVSLAVLGTGIAGLFTAAVAARIGFKTLLAASWLIFGLAGAAAPLLYVPLSREIGYGGLYVAVCGAILAGIVTWWLARPYVRGRQRLAAGSGS